MQLKNGSYVHNQLTFGLLGLRCMFKDEIIESALSKNNLDDAQKSLKQSLIFEHREMFELIFNDLFSTEEDTLRLREVFEVIDTVDAVEFLQSYRYHEVDEIDTYTNGCVETIASSILAEGEPASVLDLCSGQGVFLTEAIGQQIADEYYGVEINKNVATVSKIRMLILGQDPSHISIGDAFEKPFEQKDYHRFDAVFCHMPMGMKIDQQTLIKSGLIDEHHALKISKRDSEWAFIKAMHKLTKEKGRSIAFVRTGILFTETGKEYRKELIDSGALEGVILLPSNLMTSTNVQTAMLILSSNNKSARMVDASAYFVKGRRVNHISEGDLPLIIDLYNRGGMDILYSDNEDPTEEYQEFPYSVIVENDYSYEPTRYLLNKSELFRNAQKLGKVTDKIFRGTQIKADDHDTMTDLFGTEPNCYLLNLSDITNGFIDDGLEEVYIDEPKRYRKYMLMQNDVVISARGTKISIAVADNVDGRSIIATGNLIVIRCGDDINPYYLKAYFESGAGSVTLRSIQTGSHLFAINPKQLREMPVEVFDHEKQTAIGDKVKWMVDELKESHRRIKTVTQKLSHLFDDELREV